MATRYVTGRERWHQGFGVLRPGTTEQRVPFQTKETAQRIAAQARRAGFSVRVFQDHETEGWSFRPTKPPRQRSKS